MTWVDMAGAAVANQELSKILISGPLLGLVRRATPAALVHAYGAEGSVAATRLSAPRRLNKQDKCLAVDPGTLYATTSRSTGTHMSYDASCANLSGRLASGMRPRRRSLAPVSVPTSNLFPMESTPTWGRRRTCTSSGRVSPATRTMPSDGTSQPTGRIHILGARDRTGSRRAGQIRTRRTTAPLSRGGAAAAFLTGTVAP